MAIPLYQGLQDDFDRHDGSLSPYVNGSNIALPYEKHYDLRMFHATNLTVPWTLNDNTWWTGYRYPTFGVPQIGNPRSIVNAQTRNRTQAELDALTQTSLDALNQFQIEGVQTTGGNEEWPSTDANVTVGKDSAYRYSNTLRATIDSLSNNVTNPGFETNTTGWNVFSTGTAPTLTRVTTQHNTGVASGQLVMGAAAYSSTFTDFTMAFNTGDVVNFQVFVLGTGSSIGKTGQLIAWEGGTSLSTTTNFTITGSWQQVSASRTITGARTSVRLEVAMPTPAISDTIFVDDAFIFATTKVINSYYADDIATDFNEQSVTYFLELTLRSFPAQAASQHLDLNNSYIDVSSDINFAAQYTDSFKFADSLNSLTAGGDTFARWPRSNIIHADATKLKAVRFRLQTSGSSGTMTFIAQALRIAPSLWPNSLVGLDTKRKTLARQIPRAGGTESSSVFGDMYFAGTRPKNLTTYTQFSSGHLPATGTDDNTFRHYYRYNVTTGDRIEVRVVSRSTQTRLFIDQKIAGVTTNLLSTATNTNILTAETDYYLVTTLNGGTVTAQVYASNGLSLGSAVGTLGGTGTATTLTARGYVGLSYEPYNYDFVLYSFGSNIANFGQFVSTSFASRNVVKGVTIYPRTSPVDNLLINGTIEAFADATVTTTDGNTYKVVRSNTANQGGVRYNNAVYLGDSTQVVVSGKIQPITAVNGTYRLGLIDENDSVAWIYNLSGLLPNQFNEFNIILPAGLFPAQYFLHIQQSGSDADTFYVRDIAMNANTIGWEASIDGGTTYQPFLNALNDRWSAIKFANPNTSLKVRATALSDTAYIAGYNLVPRYTN